jgi:hypothetical protein
LNQDRHPSLLLTLACGVGIALSVFIFLNSGLSLALRALDPGLPAVDFNFWYAAGEMWNSGENPYLVGDFVARLQKVTEGQILGLRSGFYYPPQSAAVFGLLARLPRAGAHSVLMITNLVAFSLGILMLGYVLSDYRRIGILEVTLLASFIGTGSLRVNVREGQISLLAFVFMLSTYILHRSKRFTLSGINLAALTYKPTFFPWLVVYYFIRRSYRTVAVALGVAVVLTVLPLLVSQRPVLGTLADWTNALAYRGGLGEIDSPSPASTYSTLMSHLAPLVYRVFDGRSWAAESLLAIMLLLLGGVIVYLISNTSPTKRSALLDFGLISTITILSTYHRPYDDFLLFPGMLYLYIHATGRDDARVRAGWLALLAFVLFSSMLPIDLGVQLSLVVPGLSENYIWQVASQFHTWTALLLLGGLLYIKFQTWNWERKSVLHEHAIRSEKDSAHFIKQDYLRT